MYVVRFQAKDWFVHSCVTKALTPKVSNSKVTSPRRFTCRLNKSSLVENLSSMQIVAENIFR